LIKTDDKTTEKYPNAYWCVCEQKLKKTKMKKLLKLILKIHNRVNNVQKQLKQGNNKMK